MVIAVRVLTAVVGLAILAFIVHAGIMASGGYGTAAAPLMMGLGAGLAAGALAVGVAWEEGRRSLALCLVAALLAGEAWALLQTAERTIAHRDQHQAPLRAAGDERAKASERVKTAETALAAVGETPRLKKAEAAKTLADAAVVSKSAEKGCAANCAKLLQAQADAAGAEVEAARAEIASERAAAEGRVRQARADLSALPVPPSATPLADRLGIQGWSLDIAQAVLASIAANGLAALLLAFAAHGRRRRQPETIDVTPVAVAEASPAPVVTTEAACPVDAVAAPDAAVPSPRNANDEADLFARTTLRPAERGRVKLAEIPATYAAWCRQRGLDPLPQKDFGAALAALFSNVGLYKRGNGARAIVPGIEWRSREPLRIEASPERLLQPRKACA